MRIVQKLRPMTYLMVLLFSLFYICSFTIPTEYLRMIRISPCINSDVQIQNISDCLCSRRMAYPPKIKSIGIGGHFTRLNSSCSDEGTHYQTDQNVISFSMYYSQNSSKLNPKSPQTSPLNFEIGLLQNLLMMRQHYPGYTLRVYTSVPLHPGGYFCGLLCQNEDLFWCDVRKTPGLGEISRMNFRTWRFLPLGDPTVNIFHSRDLDSLISLREASAVKDWLFNSGKDHKAIMAMRDQKIGHNVAMLAGMWGADNSKLLGKSDKLRKEIISKSQLSSSQKKSFDQQLLRDLIFYPMAKDIVAYDCYNCVKWSNFTEVRPYPVKRGNPASDFVGNRVNFTGDGSNWIYPIVECPLECRPSYGLDWLYC